MLLRSTEKAGKREMSMAHSSRYTVIVMDLDKTIERSHHALDEFVKGRPESLLDLFSERDDVTLANPFGPTVRGKKNVDVTASRAASQYRDGKSTHFEQIVKVMTPDLAFIVENERYKAKVSGRQDLSTIALRVTTIFRPEQGDWRIVHRHADTVLSDRPVESAIQK